MEAEPREHGPDASWDVLGHPNNEDNHPGI